MRAGMKPRLTVGCAAAAAVAVATVMLAARPVKACSVIRFLFFASLLCAYSPVFAQVVSHATATQDASVRVPFVGCESDGQVGPLKAPYAQGEAVPIPGGVAQRLAYYKAETGFGVLAPRGWHCFGTYGSGGSTLYVTPGSINSADLFSSNWKGFEGPAIEVSFAYGGTSGRFVVAETIARVFPAHSSFVRSVISEGIQPASSFPSGPYPGDRLTYRSKEIVEFKTPANSEGLGTKSRLKKGSRPICGVAILVGRDINLLQLSMRLTPEANDLSQVIVQQIEREATHFKD